MMGSCIEIEPSRVHALTAASDAWQVAADGAIAVHTVASRLRSSFSRSRTATWVLEHDSSGRLSASSAGSAQRASAPRIGGSE
eukprot:COSAG01_NODE_3373_length_6178_cov_26.797171_1_plen_83_part_00